MIFSSKLLGSFSLSAIYSFFTYLQYRRQRQAVVIVEIYNPGLDHLRDPVFGPLEPLS